MCHFAHVFVSEDYFSFLRDKVGTYCFCYMVGGLDGPARDTRKDSKQVS